MMDRIKKITEDVARAYRQVFGDRLVAVILYGSYARGDYDSESDVDLVAIVRGERYSLQQQLKQVWDVCDDLELEYGIMISPAVIPYAEYEEYKDILPYYRNIRDEGVNIVA